jgi:hypothetical protein
MENEDETVRVKYSLNTKTEEITQQQVSEKEYQDATGGGQYNLYTEGPGHGAFGGEGGKEANNGDVTKIVHGNLFAKHGKNWLPAQQLDAAVVTARSKTRTAPPDIDNTYVAPSPRGPWSHPGLQAVTYGGGAPGAWSPGGFDPRKKTMYVFLGEDEMLALGLPAGYLATKERPEMDGEFANEIGEKVNTEPDNKGSTRNYGVGAEYVIDDDGTSVMKRANGKIDTIKRDYKHNTVDTIREK